MFCENCGEYLKDGQIQCHSCGFIMENNAVNRITENIGYGATIEEAVENAKSAFGPEVKGVQLEILELPSNNIFKHRQAKVKAFID